jgi:ribosomal protein S18 acetylase RimI-like enzyme
MKIQRVKPDQAEALTTIAFAAKRHWGYPESWIQFWAPLLTISPEWIEIYDTYCACMQGRPAGFYALSFEGERARLEHLWVSPEFMLQGVGSRLLCHALARCEQAGTCVLEIESDPNAQEFYEKMGAHKIGEVLSEVKGEPRALPVLEIVIPGLQ